MEVKILTAIHPRDLVFVEKFFINNEEQYTIDSFVECPENALIERDLVSSKEIKKIILKAYEAGQSGEEITLTEELISYKVWKEL